MNAIQKNISQNQLFLAQLIEFWALKKNRIIKISEPQRYDFSSGARLLAGLFGLGILEIFFVDSVQMSIFFIFVHHESTPFDSISVFLISFGKIIKNGTFSFTGCSWALAWAPFLRCELLRWYGAVRILGLVVDVPIAFVGHLALATDCIHRWGPDI